MKKYVSFFRMRILNGLQYRSAAFAGMATQFVWGFMEILLFRAFYQADPNAFPMEFEALTSYIWIQQAFFSLFAPYFWERDLFASIENGNVAYELCRPLSLYPMWFTKIAATRIGNAMLRCLPVLIVGSLLPAPFHLSLPNSLASTILFLVSGVLAFCVVISFILLITMCSFFTVQSLGLQIIASSLAEFLCGAILPLPFLPEYLRRFVAFLPFASMQNVPLRIYSGDITQSAALFAIALQLFWLITMTYAGKLLERCALKRLMIQGG